MVGSERVGKPVALIVEDNEALRKLNGLILRRMGLFGTILEAPDGAAALEAAKARKPDLILLDLLMPVMDGFEVLPKLRQLCPMSKIVVFSMVRREGIEQRVRSLGANEFIDKGVDEEGLAQRIHDLFEPSKAGVRTGHPSRGEGAPGPTPS